VGDVICRIDHHGNQLAYLAPAKYDGPKTKEEIATQTRFADTYKRLKNLPEEDIESWRNKVTKPRNSYVNLFFEQVLSSYYQEGASFNFIRGVRPVTVQTTWAEFAFAFDVPGRFQVCWRTDDKTKWQNQQDIDLDLVGDRQGKFTLSSLEPDTRYCLMIFQPLVEIDTTAEAKLATVENQPPPTHIKGESGHYYFRTPPRGGAEKRIRELIELG